MKIAMLGCALVVGLITGPVIAVEEELLVATFVPNRIELKQFDVLTGRIIIENTSDHPVVRYGTHEESTGDLSVQVGTPERSTFWIQGLRETGLRVRHSEIRLGPGERVVKPVCLMKANAGHVFAVPGKYTVVFKLCSKNPDREGHEKDCMHTRPVEINVARCEGDPGEYLKLFSESKTIFCSFYPVAGPYMTHGDILNFEVGDYGESVRAYLAYQGWDAHPGELFIKMLYGESVTLHAERLEKMLESVGSGDRGDWLVDSIGVRYLMEDPLPRLAEDGTRYYGNGDIILD